MGVWGGVGVGLDFFERLGLIFEQKMCLILEKELGEKFKWCSLEKLKKLCHENQKLTWSLKVKSSAGILILKIMIVKSSRESQKPLDIQKVVAPNL